MSKFIGEIEKAIDRIFLDATQSGAAVLFDEADALFGKRSEVRDAHDRYANIEVAYLLQRLEAFDGLTILTTNLRQNVDGAFLRRLRFVVDFPRPNAEDREKIWQSCLTAGSHELDADAFLLLGRKLELAGGNIRQITLRAAFAAAASNSKITLAHLYEASRAEFVKLGLPAVELQIPAKPKPKREAA
jgi:SpoVK/Ycf46/Vps4 family AAA+-type ATPase